MPRYSLCLAVLAASQAAAAVPVNIGMTARFQAGPYLLELLEAAAEANTTAYFPLLDDIADGAFATATSEVETYEKFLGLLQSNGHLTDPDALSLFGLTASLRTAAPRIEAHYQYYSTAIEPFVNSDEPSVCDNWILWNNKIYCDASFDHPVGDFEDSHVRKQLPFDRMLGSGKDVLLFADPTSPSFAAFHHFLAKGAHSDQWTYRLRYRLSPNQSRKPMTISGYGVELALKRTDYIVVDDRDAAQKTNDHKQMGDVLEQDEDLADLPPLSTSEVASLGMQASAFIMQNDNPLQALVKLIQDFPRYSSSLASHVVSEDFTKEHALNRANFGREGLNHLWMNGMQLLDRQIQPFALVDMIRREQRLVAGLQKLGMTANQSIALLGHDKVAAAKAEHAEIRFDWTDTTEEGKVILWLNDLENDDQYETFPKPLMALLHRTYPGQLPPIRRNLFHLVVPVDFSDASDQALVVQLNAFRERGIPVRFGLVPLTNSPGAMVQSRIVYHLSQSYDRNVLIAYLRGLLEQGTVTDASYATAFIQAVRDAEPISGKQSMDLAHVLEEAEYRHRTELSQLWVRRLGAGGSPGFAFINGVAIPRGGNWMQLMSVRLNEDLQFVQKGVYMGTFGEDTPVPDLFLDKAAWKRNAYITPEDDATPPMVDVNGQQNEHADLLDQVATIKHDPATHFSEWALLSVFGDFAQQTGLELLFSAIQFSRENKGVQLQIIHNPKDSTKASGATASLKINEAKLAQVSSLEELQSLIIHPESSPENREYSKAMSLLLQATKIAPGDHVAVLNGRLVGPFTAETPFDKEDFNQLMKFEQQSRLQPVLDAIEDLGIGHKLSGPLAVAKVASILALSTISDQPEGIFESAPPIRSTRYNTLPSTHTSFEVGDPLTDSIHLVAFLNPVSEQAQRWAPILKVLSELDGVYLKVYLNPKENVEELPVKRFYRYVLDSKPRFDEKGHLKSLNATFQGLPSEALLNIGLDVPPAWLVAPKVSVHDLDNIKLSTVKKDVEALYELEHILIEGHSREGQAQGPAPRGAQLVLATETNPHLTDTIVMANLGFFQFKANPGFCNIRLKEGASSRIYSIDTLGYQDNDPQETNSQDIALMDFQGTTLYPRLTRRPGMEEADVLEIPDDDDSIVAKGRKFAESLFGGAKSKSISAEVHADINIFSVASGHLYERMLNIMMVSVMKHTQHTVKFWFIEQFLSPSFKDFIPHLAREYGFRYEMVTYKWPHWLRQQKEKQREIWGYKILFLDVLFPLSLDKVIFVDADQIVRTDMMDLVNFDLEGAPYGFTPMCDSRTEMEGFRFWKQGYWANYLRGLPYHISALYVVDLRRFRAIAAGDRLRGTYHSLSADPASLSNLDQDLPNHMQFQIPIRSLPREWLWCETWCSDDSLAQARTIDLCNNPQTKEPKLDRARRQVPEWTVYDDEIAAVDRKRRGLGEEAVGINTKSRRFEDEPAHTKDEL